MFQVKRNQVVVTALAVMIAAAGYLNFQESKLSEGTQTAMQLSEEGDLTALLDEDYAALPDDLEAEEPLDPITAEVSATTGDGAAVYASAESSASSLEGYFAEAKLEREQARAKQKDLLTEMLDNQNITDAQKEKCSESMLQIQERIEKETAAESMIQSKGFSHAYVRIDDDTVDVVVSKDNLTEAEVAQIQDIVTRKTGYQADQIRISTWKQGK
ncbi:SpoIIIAH-like family protein [Anaerotignum lactatifermentans]|uniref:SpoIIIAH-like family protein n=1 Tax=Anaerotignum lactatifermentans TaxID=160404 RepID=A0ABS2G5P1_9FIRM|nr:SpoIIIAH-like family protein [Anaerotignum lactatifermentans]MBM6828081.1 SpoIIIAH-like family protein [Anaerotignum lactatifermentans]MBM6876756.1 SpoIIIAH-like family protein [Anaerotignum lactatifermentans]MBM6949664.1 SpoIIIAH-like family protein [Anaerotignum lactatifermentans]